MKNPGIYVLANTVNGKAYVGLDSNLPRRVDLHLRGKSRCPAISAAIAKHGADAFTVEIITYPGASYDALCAIESWHIAKRNTKAPNGYNLTDGGGGTFGRECSVETRQKISATRISQGVARGEKNPNFGKVPSIETRQKIGKGNRGKTRSVETRKKLSEVGRGRKHTAESKAKIGKAHKGKVVSAETRAKSSATKRRKALEKRGQGTLF